MFSSCSKPQISDLWKLWEGDSRRLTSHVTEPLTQGSLHSQVRKKGIFTMCFVRPCSDVHRSQLCTMSIHPRMEPRVTGSEVGTKSRGDETHWVALGPGHIPAARDSSSRFAGRNVQGFQWFIWMLAQVISFISFSLFFHDSWLWHVPQYCLCWVSARISWGQFKSSHN